MDSILESILVVLMFVLFSGAGYYIVDFLFGDDD